MGTNYYLYEAPCPCCGHAETGLHIGKSSYGWHFSLHIIPENGINTLDDWITLFESYGNDLCVEDEYGIKIKKKEMLSIIKDRKHPRGDIVKDWLWYRENHAEPGLNGLVRHIVDGRHCVGHGEGTWDYIMGEFS